MTSEVGSGQVAIFPTFKGFRKAVTDAVDGTVSASSSRFTAGFATSGSAAGKGFGQSFSSASSSGLKAAQAEVAKTASALSAARLKEQNAAGSVRVAEAALASARSKYAADSVQVVRAEERLAASVRSLQSAQESTATSSRKLASAQQSVADASVTAEKAGGRLSTAFSRVSAAYGSAGNDSGRKFISGFSNVLGGVLGANILTGVGFAVGRGINDVISTGISTALNSVSLASDLHETTSAISTVFGDAAPSIVAFSKTANKALGETQQQALLGAQSFGVFGKAAGLQGAKLSDFSTGLVSLAGDLASFYNTTPDDAITAISAGLRGESEPLRRYGVLLDDASLRQEALSLKIVKTTKDALTPQQRVLAAQSLIMKQTGIAQGDFGRTSEGLANQQRILTASLADAQTQLGSFLLPAFTGFVSYANSDILPRLGDIIDRVGPRFSGALQAAGPDVKDFLTKLGPLADKFTDLAITSLPGAVKELGAFAKSAGEATDVINGLIKANNDKKNPINEFLDGFFQSSVDLRHSIVTTLKDSFKDPDTGVSFTAGQNAASNFSQGVKSGSDKSFWAFAGVSQSGKQGAASADLFGTGAQTAQGFADGISSKEAAVIAASSKLAKAATGTLKTKLSIQSPSKVTRSLGAYTGDGYALGMLDRTRAVQSAASQLAAASLVSGMGSGSADGGRSGGSGAQINVTQLPGEDGRALARRVAWELDHP